MLVAPIREDARAPIRGVVQLLNREDGPFDEEDEKYLVALSTQLARALTLTTLRPAEDGGPGVVLQGPFNRIVGRSHELRAVYERVQLAAQTDATVLLRGETGTGKGLFARAIHVNSRRQARPFVTVDCTTLPAQLVESELFGHERGAFTSADRRVPGKVELAEGGTLFLDELGDLPADIQGKLLRFLQDRIFERVGGRQTLAADVRVVCATHRDLEAAVAAGRFREDLYYRVRVVEIDLPPLRSRGPEDVETLARHFAEVYAHRYGRPPPRFTPEALAAIRAHTWPGNVRELEHWIESAVVLSPDGRLAAHPWRRTEPTPIPSLSKRLLDEGKPAPAAARAVTTGDPGRVPQTPPEVPSVSLPLGLSMDDAIARYAEATIDACEGNKTEAARKLAIGRNTLTRLIRR
jgi:Nif-specific regulatory protein